MKDIEIKKLYELAKCETYASTHDINKNVFHGLISSMITKLVVRKDEASLKQLSILEQMNKFLKDFDDRFSIFKEKFSRMSIEGKSQGVEGFSLFLIHFNLAVRRLWESHEKKREWKTLQNLVHSRMGSLNKLLKSRPKKEQNVIGRHVLEGELLYLDEAKGFLDEYLQKIK